MSWHCTLLQWPLLSEPADALSQRAGSLYKKRNTRLGKERTNRANQHERPTDRRKGEEKAMGRAGWTHSSSRASGNLHALRHARNHERRGKLIVDRYKLWEWSPENGLKVLWYSVETQIIHPGHPHVVDYACWRGSPVLWQHTVSAQGHYWAMRACRLCLDWA